IATVETEPRRKSHKNRREFEEFDVLIVSAERASENPMGGSNITIDNVHRVHVVHDLSCGGNWIAAKPGDRLEIRGEYVHPQRGEDLIHFTHPASPNCGSAARSEGYIRPFKSASANAQENKPELLAEGESAVSAETSSSEAPAQVDLFTTS